MDSRSGKRNSRASEYERIAREVRATERKFKPGVVVSFDLYHTNYLPSMGCAFIADENNSCVFNLALTGTVKSLYWKKDHFSGRYGQREMPVCEIEVRFDRPVILGTTDYIWKALSGYEKTKIVKVPCQLLHVEKERTESVENVFPTIAKYRTTIETTYHYSDGSVKTTSKPSPESEFIDKLIKWRQRVESEQEQTSLRNGIRLP